MADEKTIETYLDQLGYRYEVLKFGMWKVKDDGIDNIIVSYSQPLVVLRLKFAAIPKGKDLVAIYGELLRANTELTHGAFALEKDFIVLVETLEAETLDPSELAASIEGISVAAATMSQKLRKIL